MLHLAAVGVEDAVGEVRLRLGGRLEQQHLITTDTEMAVGQGLYLRRRQRHRLAHAVDDHKIVAQAMHLGKTQTGGRQCPHQDSPSRRRPAWSRAN
jgi:hypothetical protein